MLLAVWLTGVIYLALIVLIALLVIAMIVGYELLRRDFRRLSRSNSVTESLERTLLIQEQLGELKHQVQSASQAGQEEISRLWQKTDRSLGDRLQQTDDLVGEVRQSLGAIDESSQRIFQLGAQLSGLGEALRLPAGAAGGGELWLADLLGQMLPPQHYQLNAALGNGRPIDAVVHLGNFLVGIDAGFPLAECRSSPPAAAPGAAGDEPKSGAEEPPGPGDGGALEQLARANIDRVAAECIQPDQGTVDFALMYLPAEGLYYDLIIRNSGRADSIAGYALSRRVIAVSPNTLYAYLYTIVLGLRGLRIEQHAEKIIARLQTLRGQFSRFQDAFHGLGTHLDRAANKYDQASRKLDRFSDHLTDALPGGEGGPPLLPTESDADSREPPEEPESIFSMLPDTPRPERPAPVAPPADLLSAAEESPPAGEETPPGSTASPPPPEESEKPAAPQAERPTPRRRRGRRK